VRTIAADDLWMSTAYKRDSMAIHFTWKPEWPAVKNVLPMIEAKLAPFGARPHWGKLFTMPGSRIQPCIRKCLNIKSFWHTTTHTENSQSLPGDYDLRSVKPSFDPATESQMRSSKSDRWAAPIVSARVRLSERGAPVRFLWPVTR